MNIWAARNVAFKSRTLDTAHATLRIFQADIAREDSVSIARPTTSRSIGEAVTAYCNYGMATEVLGDTAHRGFNIYDVNEHNAGRI